MSRILGIDYGDRRIGLALSDPMRIISSPLQVIEYEALKTAIATIVEVCEEHEVGQIVVGMPLNMDGSRGPRAEHTDRFLGELRARTEIPVATWDERLSTRTAESALIEAGTRREKRKGLIDKVAAQVILQHYMDVHC